MAVAFGGVVTLWSSSASAVWVPPNGETFPVSGVVGVAHLDR